MSSSTRTRADGDDDTAWSLAHLLLVWVLVGSSLAGLGIDLHPLVAGSVPLAALHTGLLFATVAVASLWVAGVRPAIGASLYYFVAQLLAYLSLALAFFPGSAPPPWQAAGVRALSIALAGALAFTDAGRRTRRWLRAQVRRLFESQTVR